MVYFFAMETTSRRFASISLFLGLLGFRFATKNHLKSALQFGGADLAGDFDFAELLATGAEIFARFGLDIGLRCFDAALELDDFAFEEMNALDGLADFVDQALLFERIEVELAKAAGHLDTGAAQGVARTQIRTLFRARDFFEFLRLLHRHQVELSDFVDLLEGLFCFCFDLFFGELFVVELDDFLDGARAGAEIFADLEQLFQDQRSARDGFQDEELAALDTLGDGNFTFARQQRNRAHFAQIHANGIVGFFESARTEVEIAVFGSDFFLYYDFCTIGSIGGGKRGLRSRKILVHIDAVTLEGGKQIVDFFRRVHLGRQGIVHLFVKQVAALRAHGDEVPHLLVFNHQRQRFLPVLAHCQPRPGQPQGDTMAERGTPGRPLGTKKMVEFHLWR